MKLTRKILVASLLIAACQASVSAAPKDFTFETAGDGYEFAFTYPSVIAKFPKLKAELERDRTATLAEVKEDARLWLADRPQDHGSITLDRQTNWKQVTNLPGYLSLTVDEYRYDGGAHGNYGRASIIWDKIAGIQIAPIDMFSSKAAFDTLVQTPFCDKLDVERSQKRDGEKVDRTRTDDWMQACPAPSDYTIILGSSDGKKFNRFSVYVGPYGAGPYSEGDYEIDLPVTSALLAAIKPAYRSAFAVTPMAGK
jgi:Deacetylase PdaC